MTAWLSSERPLARTRPARFPWTSPSLRRRPRGTAFPGAPFVPFIARGPRTPGDPRRLMRLPRLPTRCGVPGAQALRLLVSPQCGHHRQDRRLAPWRGPGFPVPRRASSPPSPCLQKPGTRARRGGVESGRGRKLRKSDIVCRPQAFLVTTTRFAPRATSAGSCGGSTPSPPLTSSSLLGVPHDELLIRRSARFKGYRGVLQLRALAPIADNRGPSRSLSRPSAFTGTTRDCRKPEPQWWMFAGDGGADLSGSTSPDPEVRVRR